MASTKKTMAVLGALSLLLGGGVAEAADPGSGLGAVTAKNSGDRVLVVDGRRYEVTERSILRNRDGARVRLAGIPAPEEGAAPGLSPLLHAEYEAVEVRGRWTLLQLRLVPSPE